MSNYLKLGLIGHPLAHSLSPVLQTAALQFAGLKGEYKLYDIEPESLTRGIKEMLASGVNGFNITIPYKEDIYKMADSFTDEAKQASAINTVKVQNGKLIGHNTDIIGFKTAFTETFIESSAKKTALIIGAGGAAKAVVIGLTQLGFENIRIKGRDPKKVQSFITEMKANLDQLKNRHLVNISAAKNDQENYADLNLLVNASPIGLKNETAPEWFSQIVSRLNSDCLCFDLVYKKTDKPTFTRLALENGLKVIDGLPMLIHQARYAFEFWTSINVPVEIMRSAVNKL